MEASAHWDRMYGTKTAKELSWTRAHLNVSLELIRGAGMGKATPVIDAGGGESTLVDDLLAEGYEDVTVLDVSEQAIARARSRLGVAADRVTWMIGDVLEVKLPQGHYGIWHDRAVFHFLTEAAQREVYVRGVREAMQVGGHVIVGTFATDGPETCSGLAVRRYDIAGLGQEFGEGFRLMESAREIHETPLGTVQPFVYGRWERV